MKVWILFRSESFEGDYVEGIYSTEEKAQEARKMYPQDDRYTWYTVEERFVE